MLKRNKLEIIDDIRKEIKKEYLNTGTTPWIIGYSGGKDSTTVLQLVVEVLLDLREKNLAHKEVYVISSDTLVENPLVIAKTKLSIDNINRFAKEKGLPLIAEMIYPRMDNSFFTNLIGKGYPSPIQSFRWCTDRIKIMPANDYIYSKVSENGEVVLLLGTREDESASRKRSMEKHYIKGSNLSMHSTIQNAWTYSPIAKLTTNEVWGYLLKNHCPWGDSNNDLFQLYSSSSQDGECPLVIDDETKAKQTCGNSRFGCWACTVVVEDKSLRGFIDSGEKWLMPLLEYRNYLVTIRDQEDKRMIFNRKGRIQKVEVQIKGDRVIIPKKLEREESYILLDDAVTEKEAYELLADPSYDLKKKPILVKNGSKYYRVGLSGFTLETRVDLLKRLFEVEKKLRKTTPSYEIIRKEEILSIDKMWREDGYTKESAIDLYNHYQEEKLTTEENSIDKDLLHRLCEEENFDESTMYMILQSANKYRHLKNRSSNVKEIQKKLSTQKLLLRSKP